MFYVVNYLYLYCYCSININVIIVECHQVLRAHGQLQMLCDEFEGLSIDAAHADVSRDAADRWIVEYAIV